MPSSPSRGIFYNNRPSETQAGIREKKLKQKPPNPQAANMWAVAQKVVPCSPSVMTDLIMSTSFCVNSAMEEELRSALKNISAWRRGNSQPIRDTATQTSHHNKATCETWLTSEKTNIQVPKSKYPHLVVTSVGHVTLKRAAKLFFNFGSCKQTAPGRAVLLAKYDKSL